jgi:cytochrome c-type biogenesis protein CcsB
MKVSVHSIILTWLCCLLLTGLAAADPPEYVEQMRYLAVQQGGRLKPLDTFALESMRFITGKAEFEKKDAVQTVLEWYAGGLAKVGDLKVIEFREKQWKTRLGLEMTRRHFSLNELKSNAELNKVREQLHRLPPQAKIPHELNGAAELLSKMNTLENLVRGGSWTMVPAPGGLTAEWASLMDLDSDEAGTIPQLTEARQARDALLEELRAGQATPAAAERLGKSLKTLGAYPAGPDLAREVHYNHFHPFRKAWILYLFSLVCLFLTTARSGGLYYAGLASAGLGIALHAYGFYLRCMIAGRPPVTNMYESVIWVAFGAVAFALVFETLYRARSYLMAACAGAVICLVLADQLPAVLDPSIRPLTPVLRSNFWLTIHVLTITLGYAAFLLALGLGHMVVWKTLMNDRKEELGNLHAALYRALQVGVLLLAAGTMLGGVWAYYSWGRFWGWDPKEVWALIALLGYLAILHARYTGWVGQYGIAALSVVAFQGVLMAWYGVNFVLGAGLHSYGFGNGGVGYVATFCLLEILFVASASFVIQKRRKQLS